MCGIVAYLGPKNSLPIIINGLKRLEYRGYDSAGLAVLGPEKIICQKVKGRVALLESLVQKNPLVGNLAIAHTRWATHGEPSDINAHPHFDCQKKIAVVHNGIIENYLSLKKWLVSRGHKFVSQTDTEVVPHLIEEFYKEDNNFLSALRKTLGMIEGAYALAIISSYEPGKIFAVRFSSPLVLGIINKGEYILASDAAPIIEYTKNVIYLDDNEIAVLSDGGYEIRDRGGRRIEKEVQKILWDLSQIEKSGFPHFMLKEIFEQPETIRNAIRGRVILKDSRVRLGGLEREISLERSGRRINLMAIDYLTQVERIIISACGTSWHAGLIGKYLLENLVGVPVEVEYASELRYRQILTSEKTALIVISQSGETADTLAVLRKAKELGLVVFGIVNVVGSSIARETDAGIYLHAGPEIGVASTKAFTSEVAVLILLSLLLAQKRKLISKEKIFEILQDLEKIPNQIQSLLDQNNKIDIIAKKYYQFNNFLYLGRGYNYPVALEGALKLKEISYIHAEGYPAAEMKHGPIALIDEKMPVVILATDTEDIIYQKVVSNIEEVRARGANTIVVATEGNREIEKLANEIIYVPKTRDFFSPLLNVIPLQLLAYHMAVLRGCDVDKPRNLAKSVTVE
jgi:glucosamine--fructose-6-phosphate aminotransferase (isomerizing)